MALSSRPSSSTGESSGFVSYKLARQRVIDGFRTGEHTENEVCDAQSELRRVAHNHATPLNEPCPICDGNDLVTVVFAFGAGLPNGGRCISDRAELRKIQQSGRAARAYRVEVCRQCWWNHLRESFPIDQDTATVS